MIVVDVGSAQQKREESIYKLATRYRPDTLFAFDPQNDEQFVAEHYGRITTIFRSRLAAWTEDGSLSWEGVGISAGVPKVKSPSRTVECFNLIAFLRVLPPPIILKLDCEGAEFPILHALVEADEDQRLDLILVEWHDGTERGKDFYGHGWATMGRPVLRCPVREWQ